MEENLFGKKGFPHCSMDFLELYRTPLKLGLERPHLIPGNDLVFRVRFWAIPCGRAAETSPVLE